MENKRYDFLPIINRKQIKWPNGAKVALWVGPNIEYFHVDKPIPSNSTTVPNVLAYTLRDYGSRIGVFRMMEVLDKYDLKASVLLNADVCDHQPQIIAEGKKRDWEWLGHGLTNNTRMTDYPPEEERNIIHQVKEKITKATGVAPKGWLGPGWAETFNTLDHLAAEGFEYVCDWGCDDQPFAVRVRTGKMVSVPYRGVADLPLLKDSYYTPPQYLQAACDAFDTIYRQSERVPSVFTVGLHPYLIGASHVIKYLDKALEYILSHEGVWKTTAGEIASWYYQHYYEDPGRPS